MAIGGVLILAIATVAMRGQTNAQATQKTVLDGVFTATQADRGGIAYGTECAMCHEGADVDGPPLTGGPFIDRWREDTLDSLFAFIKTGMPQSAPGSLPDAAYRDILAHLLHENSFPAGSRELTSEVIAGTLLVGPNGPQPLPAGALVRVVGCLTQSPAREWVLARAGQPARVRSGKDITTAEVTAAAGAVLGTQTFTLQNVGEGGTALPGNGAEGQKLIAKGALTQRAGAVRLHVTAVEVLAGSCA
jgi:S-disulfanyl-L-cysteine oxidoreductase SoxD